MTGPAGCGKTELLKAVRAKYPQAVVTATTGSAASALGGMTIHAALGYTQRGWGTSLVKVPEGGTLIIDEVSMLSKLDLDGIDKTLRARYDANCPLGGIRVIGEERRGAK